MLNKLIAIISFFLISGAVAFPQNVSLRVESEYGTFSMKDLKDFQAVILPDIGVNVESLSEFPPFFGFGVEGISYFKSGIGLGMVCEFFSTGATNYYEDYSGSYKMNMLTNSINIGTILSIRQVKNDHFNLFFEIDQGIKKSRLKLSEELVIIDPVSSITLDLESTSWWIKPIYRCEYKIYKFISAGAFVGAEINVKSILHLKEDKDAILRNGKKDVTIDWTGLRAGLHLSFNFPYGRSEPE